LELVRVAGEQEKVVFSGRGGLQMTYRGGTRPGIHGVSEGALIACGKRKA